MTTNYDLTDEDVATLNFVVGYVQGTSSKDGEEELMKPIELFVKLVRDITIKSGLK